MPTENADVLDGVVPPARSVAVVVIQSPGTTPLIVCSSAADPPTSWMP